MFLFRIAMLYSADISMCVPLCIAFLLLHVVTYVCTHTWGDGALNVYLDSSGLKHHITSYTFWADSHAAGRLPAVWAGWGGLLLTGLATMQ